MDAGIAIVVYVTACLVYFLPSLMASRREHSEKYLILVINIVAGWTVIGWLFCIYVVAFKPDPAVVSKPQPAGIPPPPPGTPDSPRQEASFLSMLNRDFLIVGALAVPVLTAAYLMSPGDAPKEPSAQLTTTATGHIENLATFVDRLGDADFSAFDDELLSDTITLISSLSDTTGAVLGALPHESEHRIRIEQLASAMARRQEEVFPNLRRRFAEVIGDALRGDHLEVAISGDASEVIRFVGPTLSDRSLVDVLHGGVRDWLHQYRFRRTEYRTSMKARDSVWFELETPSDEALVVWEKGAEYRVVK